MHFTLSPVASPMRHCRAGHDCLTCARWTVLLATAAFQVSTADNSPASSPKARKQDSAAMPVACGSRLLFDAHAAGCVPFFNTSCR